ncbi:MAG TPA: cupin domain-containing protein [Caulobacteraceae bacterium]|nr:cupin domain-containing protein [Caulobacteraceae bacterium]
MTVEHAVKQITAIAKGPGLLVREFVFAPGEATAWHRHSQVTDLTYGLEGRTTLEMRGPDETVQIGPGERRTLPPGRVHRLVNLGNEDARVLLIQHGGSYDFVEAG